MVHNPEAANTIIVETRGVSVESNKSNKCSNAYHTQLGKVTCGFQSESIFLSSLMSLPSEHLVYSERRGLEHVLRSKSQLDHYMLCVSGQLT